MKPLWTVRPIAPLLPLLLPVPEGEEEVPLRYIGQSERSSDLGLKLTWRFGRIQKKWKRRVSWCR